MAGDSRNVVSREAVVSISAYLLLLIYVSTFWGQTTRLLPAPINQLHDIYARLVFDSWFGGITEDVSDAEALALFKTMEAYFLGFGIPLATWCLIGRRVADLGLQPAIAGTGLIGTGIAALAVLPAVMLFLSTETPWGSPLYEGLELAAMLPEHFFIFGLLTAILLPQHRLTRGDINKEQLPQDSQGRRVPRLLVPNSREVNAMILSALAFVLIHLGFSTMEAVAALPVGMLFAYVTLSCQSIWPALVAHWGLNLCLMIWTGLPSAWS